MCIFRAANNSSSGWRVLYSQPQILLLDEATSALDRRSESKIFDLLKSFKSEMAVLMVTHRLSSIKHADRVYLLEHGKTQLLKQQDLSVKNGKILSEASLDFSLKGSNNFAWTRSS